MARRRSLNRRWSRRSGNAMELNPDSELIDEENPAWWKNLEQTTMLRTSAQTSFADVTEPVLTSNSLINESDIHDRWWDNLDRTSLHSSRRFSTRKSINPEDAVQDSIASEGTEDISIKKRKILLRARQRQSGGTETFLRAFDDSDVAQSEPVPSKKRKTQSPTKSDADIPRRKSRVRHSRSLADVDREDASNANTSNDTDVVVKARPRAFKKKAAKLSTGVYDEILTEAGGSGLNTGKNAPAIQAAKTPSKVIDSNESGFTGPTASHRKRLSTISKKLDMSSDDSEPGTRKARFGVPQKPRKENTSFNPFDEILSGQLNESSASAGAANKSGRSSTAERRISKSLKEGQTLRASTIVDAEGAAKDISARESQLRKKIGDEVNEETIGDEEKGEILERDRRSSSGLEQNSRVSKRRTEIAGVEETVTSEWAVPDTQEDPRISTRRTKHSTIIVESMDLDELPESQETNRRSSVMSMENLRRSKSRTRNATIEETATSESDVPGTQRDSRKSTRRTKNSTIVTESVDPDDLPESQKTKRRTRNATIEETATSESDVPETQEVSRKSTRRSKNSTIVAESVDPDDLPESQNTNRRSSEGLKENLRNSKSRTRNATIEETATSESDVPGTQEVSRKSTRRSKNSTAIGESANVEELPEARRRSRRSSSVTKINPRNSRRRTRHSTISEATIEDEDLPGFQEKSVKSTSAVKENPRDSIRGAIFKGQTSQLIEPSILAAKSRSQLFQDWETSGSEDDDVIKTTERSTNVSHNHSLTHKTLELSVPQLTSTKILDSRQIEDLEDDSEKDDRQEKIHEIKRRSRRSKSRALADSAYELPDKERSGSLIISMSENESPNKNLLPETSAEKSPRKKGESSKSARESVNRSIPDARSEKSLKSAAPLNASRPRDDFGESDNENDFHQAIKDSGKTTKNHFAEEATVSRKSVANTNVFQDLNSDQSISEELAIGSWNLNSSRRSSRLERKANESRRSTGRLSGQFDQSISEGEKSRTQKSNLNLSRRSSRRANDSKRATETRQSGQFDKSISEEEERRTQKSNLNLSRRSSRADRRANESKRATGSRQSGQSDKSISKEEERRTQESNLNLSRRSSRLGKRSATAADASSRQENFGERTSDVEKDLAEASEARRISPPLDDRANTSRKSAKHRKVSGKRMESDVSVSDEESNLRDKSGAGRKTSVRPNVSRQRLESDESVSEGEPNSKSTNQAPKNKSHTVSRQRIESDESNMEEDAENLENTNPALGNSANRSYQPPADVSRPQNTTNRNKSSFSTVENVHGESSTTIPSEPIPVAPALTKLPHNTSSFLGKSKGNATGAQKNITDFFQSKFLQKTDMTKTLDSFTSFDKEKLERVQKEVERKRQEMAAARIREAAKKKQIPVVKRPENFLKTKKLRTNENARKEAAKPPKVVDKAYIVNGQVYKRPKLPRPKPWVTDRLYRHLWKKMEPKYELRTRVKSENFVEQLSGVVALTIRRKKYESYKAEVDALMEEMARLNIIKTRNDFYDFCYDYLPYDFRVKVTPMLLPGNVRNIPYDPATLHTPILREHR